MPWGKNIYGFKKFNTKHMTSNQYKYLTREELKRRVPSMSEEYEQTNLPQITKDDELWDLDLLKGTKASDKLYSAQQKVKYATAFSITGDRREACEMAGVPISAAMNWHKQEWWPIVQERIRKLKSEELDAKITGLIDQCMYNLSERLDDGDEVILKDGSTKKQKVKAKELAVIFAILHDKRALGRGEVTRRTETVDPAKMLEKLKEQFKNVTKDIEGETLSKSPSDEGERL